MKTNHKLLGEFQNIFTLAYFVSVFFSLYLAIDSVKPLDANGRRIFETNIFSFNNLLAFLPLFISIISFVVCYVLLANTTKMKPRLFVSSIFGVTSSIALTITAAPIILSQSVSSSWFTVNYIETEATLQSVAGLLMLLVAIRYAKVFSSALQNSKP
jgi:hypothetical protein